MVLINKSNPGRSEGVAADPGRDPGRSGPPVDTMVSPVRRKRRKDNTWLAVLKSATGAAIVSGLVLIGSNFMEHESKDSERTSQHNEMLCKIAADYFNDETKMKIPQDKQDTLDRAMLDALNGHCK